MKTKRAKSTKQSRIKVPRTAEVMLFVTQVVGSMMKNEPYTIRDSLSRVDNLGGIYIKFLQLVALQINSRNQSSFNVMLSAFEHSRAEQLDVQKFLTKHSPALLQNVTSIDTEPFATGSFGQVYHAQLLTGEKVIVKILRPNVEKYLRYDLRLLNMLSAGYSVVDKEKVMDLRAVFKEFRKTCLQETDYKREAAVATYYYESYKDHPQIVIPKTYNEFSNDKILVQDCIEGLSVAELMRLQNEGVEPRSYMQTYYNSDLFSQLQVVGSELLIRGISGQSMQADPHPGNIILLPNNQVALIDFGMVTELTENRLAFYEILNEYRQFYNGNLSIENFAMATLKCLAPDLFMAIVEADRLFRQGKQTGVGVQSGENLLDKLRVMTREIAHHDDTLPIINSLLERRMIMKAMMFAINRNNRFGFSFDMRSVTFLKASHMFMVLVAHFEPKTTTIMTNVIDDVMAYGEANYEQLIDTNQKTMAPSEALELLSVWFDKMSRNDPWLTEKMMGGMME